ncbi:MAG TPA: hypothetical protein VH575_27755 [Gemmataceae bacterium]|jgi:hypothetical protein
MFRLAKWLPCMAVLAGAIMLGGPPTARADFTLTLEDVNAGSGSIVTIHGTGTVSTGGFINVGSFNVSVSGISTAPANNPADVNQTTSTFSYSGSGSDTLKVKISDDTFTGFGSGQTATLNLGLSTTKIADGVTGTATAFYTDGGGTTTAGPVSLSGPFSAPGGESAPPSSAIVATGLGSTFTLGNELDITVNGSTKGIDSNFTVDSNIAVPAPPSMVMAFSALPIFGLSAWLRRRKMALLAA